MPKRLKAAILGYGRMGRGFVAAMQASGLWDVAAAYDICGAAREVARQQVATASVYDSPEAIFNDPSIDAVGLFYARRCASVTDPAGAGESKTCARGKADRR